MGSPQGDKSFLQPKGEYYKYCYIPSCKNTTVTAPNKLFICVPAAKVKRKAWLVAAGYPKDYKSTGARFCCEDHLDLKNDIENYLELEFHGGGTKRLRQGVVPRFNMTKPIESTHATKIEPEDVTLGIGITVENGNFSEDETQAKDSEYNVDNLSPSGFAFVGVSLNDATVDDTGKCEKWTQTAGKEYESKHVQAKPETRVKIVQTVRSTRDKCV